MQQFLAPCIQSLYQYGSANVAVWWYVAFLLVSRLWVQRLGPLQTRLKMTGPEPDFRGIYRQSSPSRSHRQMATLQQEVGKLRSPKPGLSPEVSQLVNNTLKSTSELLDAQLTAQKSRHKQPDVMDALWQQVQATAHSAECRAHATMELSSLAGQRHAAAEALGYNLDQTKSREQELERQLKQQVLRNIEHNRKAHAMLLKVVEAKRRLSARRQQELRERKHLMREAEWHQLQAERAQEEVALQRLSERLTRMQASQEQQVEELNLQLSRQGVRTSHMQQQLASAQQSLEALQKDARMLQQAIRESLGTSQGAGRSVSPVTYRKVGFNSGAGADAEEQDVAAAVPGAAGSPTSPRHVEWGVLGGKAGSSPERQAEPPGQQQEQLGSKVKLDNVFGVFVKDQQPVARLDQLRLDVEAVSSLPPAMRTAYLLKLSTQFSHLHNLNQHLRRILLATSDFNRTHDLLDCLDCITQRIADVLGCAGARVMVLDTHNRVFRWAQVSQDGTRSEVRTQVQPGLALHCVLTGPGHVAAYHQFDQDTAYELPECDLYLNYPLHNCMLACVASPTEPNKVLAVVQAFNKSHDQSFGELDEFNLRLMIHQAAMPIENALAFAAMQQRDSALAKLQELSSTTMSSSSREQLLEHLATKGKQLLGAHRLQITLLDIPLSEKASQQLSPVTSPRSTALVHKCGLRVTEDELRRTKYLRRMVQAHKSRSRRASMAASSARSSLASSFGDFLGVAAESLEQLAAQQREQEDEAAAAAHQAARKMQQSVSVQLRGMGIMFSEVKTLSHGDDDDDDEEEEEEEEEDGEAQEQGPQEQLPHVVGEPEAPDTGTDAALGPPANGRTASAASLAASTTSHTLEPAKSLNTKDAASTSGTKQVLNPRQRRSSISAYTNYQQLIGMTPLVKEALRRRRAVTRQAAQDDPQFSGTADPAFYSLRLLVVPLRSPTDDILLGAMQVVRGWPVALEPEEAWRDPTLDVFSQAEVELAEQLAQQAVVAFENVRVVAGVSSLPQLLSDMPEGISLMEAAARVSGAVMQVCPCEDVCVLIRSSATTTSSSTGKEQGRYWVAGNAGGADSGSQHTYPITPLLNMPFSHGMITMTVNTDPGDASKPPEVFVGEQQEPMTLVMEPDNPALPHLTSTYRSALCVPVFSLAASEGSQVRSQPTWSSSSASYSVGSGGPGGTRGSGAQEQQEGSGQAAVSAIILLINRLQRGRFDRCDVVLMKGLAAQASVLLAAANLQVEVQEARQSLTSLLSFSRQLTSHLELPTCTPQFTQWINSTLPQLLPGCTEAGVLWVNGLAKQLVKWHGAQACFVLMPETASDLASAAHTIFKPMRFSPSTGQPVSSPMLEQSTSGSDLYLLVPIVANVDLPPATQGLVSRVGGAALMRAPSMRVGGRTVAGRLNALYGVVYFVRSHASDGHAMGFASREVHLAAHAAQQMACWIDGSAGLDLRNAQAPA